MIKLSSLNKQREVRTKYFLKQKAVLVWDGQCSFCEYWKVRWEQMAKGKLYFQTSADATEVFQDIDPDLFHRSVCLIDQKGIVYTGAKAVYLSYRKMDKMNFLNYLYEKSDIFRRISESAYYVVANNRDKLLKLTYLMFGKNPALPKHYWAIYLLLLLVLLFLAKRFL